MLRKIVLLALPGVAPFEFGVVCEVFGIDRSDAGGPVFDFSIATADPGPVRTSMGYDMVIANGLEVAADADLVAVPAHTIDRADERVLEVIRAAEARGAWVLSVCSGAFTLAQAGILEGRRATTHWMHTDKLASSYPGTVVDPDVLFVEDRGVITSAGTAAGIDAALHVVRKELGAAAANIVARRMVVPPQRDGGQSQYIDHPIKQECADSFAEVAEWMLENLHEDLTVDQLSRRALMSNRTFARRFRAEMAPRRLLGSIVNGSCARSSCSSRPTSASRRSRSAPGSVRPPSCATTSCGYCRSHRWRTAAPSGRARPARASGQRREP